MKNMKAAKVTVKDLGPASGDDAGQFTAIVSVFNVVDSVRDMVLPGAFLQTIAEWEASGNKMPVCWAHDWSLEGIIGYVLKAEETAFGLQVLCQLYLDDEDGAKAFRLLQDRVITQFSFAYDIVEQAFVDSEELGYYYELRQVKLYEVGPCLLGANEETELLETKAKAIQRGYKEGRVLATQHMDSLKSARSAIDGVISAAEKAEADEKSGAASSQAKSTTEPANSGAAPQESAAQAKTHANAQAAARLALINATA